MRLLILELILLLSAVVDPSAAASSDDSKEEAPLPCTIHNPITNAFFDLSAINLLPPDETGKKSSNARNSSWHARGYDYGANFTLNICGPVIEPMSDVVGIDRRDWGRIGGYYEMDGKNYSIGMNRSEPVLRGKRLLLNYTDGSPCPSSSSRDRRTILPSTTESYRGRALDDDDGKGDDKDDDGRKGSDSTRRKTSIISLTCDRDPTKPPAVVSFIASPDDCTYIFDVHTIAACATINVQKQTLGPSGVFGVIAIIAILVYIIGGVVYQRVVMHQRGWRQLPNYALWASMTSFVKDMVVIIGASFMRCMPGGRSNRRWLGGSRPTTNGYSGLNGSAAEHGNGSTGSGRGGRGRSGSDDENRLIDQLDEEWDD